MTLPAEDELYQAALVTRAKQGRTRGRLSSPQHSITLDNPLCGDRVILDVDLAHGRVSRIGHQVRGCLLCEAAAELIALQAPGKTAADLAGATSAVTAILKEGKPAPAGEWSSLAIFAPVHRVKSRQECVLLPFEALNKALAAG
ncbi:MAG TPA: iron-sulfur cluster assembly scaffold protein [Dongiaceae bacterium]|jgi:nitrogen fixation NifU-like protein